MVGPLWNLQTSSRYWTILFDLLVDELNWQSAGTQDEDGDISRPERDK